VLLMEVHAHLATSEIIGLLAGLYVEAHRSVALLLMLYK
jgi:hypothetical protein